MKSTTSETRNPTKETSAAASSRGVEEGEAVSSRGVEASQEGEVDETQGEVKKGEETLVERVP